MDNLRGLLGVRKIYKISSEWVRELCRVTKGVYDGTEERRFWHTEVMDKSSIAKSVCEGEVLK